MVEQRRPRNRHPLREIRRGRGRGRELAQDPQPRLVTDRLAERDEPLWWRGTFIPGKAKTFAARWSVTAHSGRIASDGTRTTLVCPASGMKVTPGAAVSTVASSDLPSVAARNAPRLAVSVRVVASSVSA